MKYRRVRLRDGSWIVSGDYVTVRETTGLANGNYATKDQYRRMVKSFILCDSRGASCEDWQEDLCSGIRVVLVVRGGGNIAVCPTDLIPAPVIESGLITPWP